MVVSLNFTLPRLLSAKVFVPLGVFTSIDISAIFSKSALAVVVKEQVDEWYSAKCSSSLGVSSSLLQETRSGRPAQNTDRVVRKKKNLFSIAVDD